MDARKTEINASWFDAPDTKDHVGYSAEEYDIYETVSAKGIKAYKLNDHRLTLWKNHKTGCFELIEHRFDGTGDFVLIASKELQTVLDKATERLHQAWTTSKERFVAVP